MNGLSRISFLIVAGVILYGGLLYYPKWEKEHNEATIGWDVSGYYAYLPAVFIYRDLKKAAFLDTIVAQYQPTPVKSQGFVHRSGNYVFKYSMGQSLQFLPWFLAAHFLPPPQGTYPKDGFSKPYQAAISWGSLLIALLGLWVARWNLLQFFSDRATAATLLLLVLGTNYLNYAAIDGAMTHNWLFTCYSLIICCTIKFYRKPGFLLASIIGVLCGWAALTRPTEVIAILIPLLWNVGSRQDLKERLALIRIHFPKFLLASAFFCSMGFLQLAYWKYVGGEWLIYSYEDQGFSWLRPHLLDVLFSYRAGWLVYSPLMVVAIIGLTALKRQHPAIFPTVLLFLLINLYIVSAWEIWWYGGSLGMRALVQSYALWLFPFAAAITWILQRRIRALLVAPFVLICIWLNLWWTNEAHYGKGAFIPESMTKSFFWQVLGKPHFERDWLKLLDTKDFYKGEDRFRMEELLDLDFASDSSGSQLVVLDRDRQFSPEWEVTVPQPRPDWLRASCVFACDPKEWEWWRMTQFIVRFSKDAQVVRDNMIRLQRHVDGNETKSIFFDTEIPDEPFDKVTVFFWNAEGDKPVRIHRLRIETFAEKP